MLPMVIHTDNQNFSVPLWALREKAFKF